VSTGYWRWWDEAERQLPGRCARADSTINRHGMRKVVDQAKQMNRPKQK